MRALAGTVVESLRAANQRYRHGEDTGDLRVLLRFHLVEAVRGDRLVESTGCASPLDRRSGGSAPIAATPKGSARTLEQTFLGARPGTLGWVVERKFPVVLRVTAVRPGPPLSLRATYTPDMLGARVGRTIVT
jgi:hypothetical protein